MTYQRRSRRPKILETHPSADVDDDDIAANVADIEPDISTDDGSQAATLRAWQDAQLDEANIQTEVNMPRSQAGASYAVDDPDGNIDDLGGGNTNDLGSYSSLGPPYDFMKR